MNYKVINNNQYLQKLLEAREQLLKNINNLSDDERVSFKDSTGELSSYDNHPGDQGTELFEREKDIGLKDNSISLLNKVENALDRIDNGTYSECSECGQQIDQERLGVVPYTDLCRECSQEKDNFPERADRPKEEEVLSRPFARTFTDGGSSVIYDGEDAWQEVAQYGTSSDDITDNDELDETDNNMKRDNIEDYRE
jgi:YteA family regulatory protein